MAYQPTRLNLRPGQSRAVMVSFPVPRLARAGAVELVVWLVPREGTPSQDEPDDAWVAVAAVVV